MTETTGKIIKVSGPLVVANGMKGAQMYEVVRVSKQRLVGEIIELRQDTASIQVYEETSGIGPGEPVYLTGAPLSVELGPGIMENFYDGVQRPLEEIAKQAGHYITRGIEVKALNREKKWKFTPAAKIGDSVSAGDVLGTVPETSLVLHKIMVPPEVQGKILTIAQEGEYTVEKVVAEIKTEKGVHEVKLYQKWPIRKPRPVKKKMLPTEPLITGQRILDTFFPIAKGGTASVPGPFGAGKCVSGDTKVSLANGEIINIKKLFDIHKNKGQKTVKKHEEYTILDKPIQVLSYIDGKILVNAATSVYKGKTSQLIEITTKTGKKIKITPVHKLFITDENLNIAEKQAKDLKHGDYVVAPRKLPAEGRKISINPADYIPEARVTDKNIISNIPVLLEKLTKKYGTLKKVSEKLNVSYDIVIGYKLKKNNPTIAFTEKLFSLTKKKLAYKHIKGERDNHVVTIPRITTKDFAEFLGLILGDGMIKGTTIRFYNNDTKLQAHFSSLSNKLFNIATKETITNTVTTRIINSSVLAKFILRLGYPEYKKFRTCSIPSIVLKSKENVLSAFLGAYFLTEGSFSKNHIELSTASKKMASDLANLLSRLGIVHSIKKHSSNNNYRVSISNKEEIARFFSCCNLGNFAKFKKVKSYLAQNKKSYTAKDIVPVSARFIKALYEQAGKPYKKLKEKGVEIHNYIGANAENMSRATFRILADTLKTQILQKVAYNHLDHVFYDEITDIKVINKDTDVYDLEVPFGHNFVGGNSPIFLHNTVIQHQLAKWADADIIVYIGCGERGNEMTDVLNEFPELEDPRSKEPLMKRTTLIANTSNMPVAAREASVYTGMTLAEYYRDMGYKVALMADSTSRWAEAMREISGRLEEMPGEEGYPAYLGSKTAAFYERAGNVECLGSPGRKGSLSAIGAVSPPGGDLSEPVTQNTLRVTKAFWGLDAKLAYARHYPSINWLTSYSLYGEQTIEYFKKHAGADWVVLKNSAMALLQKEAELQEIVRLVGVDALSQKEQLTLETAKSLREDYLQQNAFDEIDTYSSLKKMYLILKAIITFHNVVEKKLAQSAESEAEEGKEVKLEDFAGLPVKEEIARAKMVPEDELNKLEALIGKIELI